MRIILERFVVLSLQIVRQMHVKQKTLIGLACNTLCEQIASIASVLNAKFVSSGGCFDLTLDTNITRDKGYPTFLPVAPRDDALGKVILKVIQKFGQVFLCSPFCSSFEIM